MPALRIFLAFFIAAIAGTLLHECGHAFVALLYGFHPQVHYAFCTSMSDADWVAVKEGIKQYEIYPHSVWITLGGPIQTLLTGSIGLIALLLISRRQHLDAFNPRHLFWIVLTYFHSRWVMNSVGILYKIYFSDGKSRSDEVRLFRYWDFDIAIGTWLLLTVSCLLLAYTTFVLVKHHRWQLVLFGGLGSLAGGWFWLGFAGRMLMP